MNHKRTTTKAPLALQSFISSHIFAFTADRFIYFQSSCSMLFSYEASAKKMKRWEKQLLSTNRLGVFFSIVNLIKNFPANMDLFIIRISQSQCCLDHGHSSGALMKWLQWSKISRVIHILYVGHCDTVLEWTFTDLTLPFWHNVVPFLSRKVYLSNKWNDNNYYYCCCYYYLLPKIISIQKMQIAPRSVATPLPR